MNSASVSDRPSFTTKRHSRVNVEVTLDTSVIYTKASELVALDVKRLIRTSYQHLDVRWQMPRLVVLERRHQMATEAMTLVKHRAHLEFLSQQQLDILSAEGIEARIAAFVDEQLKALRLERGAHVPARQRAP